MAHDFDKLREQMPADRRQKIEERAAALLLAMDLTELRGSLELTQEELAARLRISQSNVSRLERRADMLVSTLREVIEACGGERHLVADFPDGAVEITQFNGKEAVR
jgi:DNA-binding transcriptional regulator YiaG